MREKEIECRGRSLHVREVPRLAVVLRAVAIRERQDRCFQRSTNCGEILELFVDAAETGIALGLTGRLPFAAKDGVVVGAGEVEHAVDDGKLAAAASAS